MVELWRDDAGVLRWTRDDSPFPIQEIPIEDSDCILIDVHVQYCGPPPYILSVTPQRATLEEAKTVFDDHYLDAIWQCNKDDWEEFVADEVGGCY